MKTFVRTLLLAAIVAVPAFAAPKKEAKPAKAPVVVMKTSLGEIKIELNQEKSPISVKNFLTYVDEKFYDGTIFHRVINNFMIQGGGFTKDMTEKKTHAPIKNESSTNGLKNEKYTIAMARLPQPDSATAQFFINVVDNAGLDYPNNGGYAVFGRVIAGEDVVDKIKAVKTTTVDMYGDVPVEPVIIQSVKRAN